MGEGIIRGVLFNFVISRLGTGELTQEVELRAMPIVGQVLKIRNITCEITTVTPIRFGDPYGAVVNAQELAT